MIRPIVGVVLYVALFAAFLFPPARTFHWRAAWILLAVILVVRMASVIRLWSTQRELLEERAKVPLHRGQIGIDRPLLIAFMATFAGVVAFCSFDRWRLHLLPLLPTWIRVLGLVLFVAGWWLTHLTLATNRFAVTTVRYQEERGQAVVDRGVYAIVRHPMYASMFVVMPGMAAWLGSAAGIIACAVPLGILGVRILIEERLLRGKLEGYEEYTRRVRSRIVPGVW
jgi:protein-S-isoprenylcysteine O-methyltransferase Ste14